MTEHKASMPTGKPVAYFIPTGDFEHHQENGELLGNYRKGTRYTLREGNTMLADLCAEWGTAGKIILMRA